MNRRIPFVANELQVVDERVGVFGGAGTPIYNTPVLYKENVAAMYFEKQPYWLVTQADSGNFRSELYNVKLGRGSGADITDAFGIEWEYIAVTGGAIVRPGEPFVSDANELKDKIKFPDLDSWDWAGEAEKVKLDPRFSIQPSLVNGFWFERLISFMDFAEAAVALIDPEQKQAVKEFFEASTDFAFKVVDKICQYWPAIDGINVHDDWGAQKDPFFSNEVAYELFVPYMKALTDHIHSKGKYATLHSCGHVEHRVQCFIDGGFDQWQPQLMNNTWELYEEFGDKIIIAVVPELYNPETTSEAEQRQRARDHVDRFCRPGKPSVIGFYGAAALTPAFRAEVYEYSRRHYYKQ